MYVYAPVPSDMYPSRYLQLLLLCLAVSVGTAFNLPAQETAVNALVRQTAVEALPRIFKDWIADTSAMPGSEFPATPHTVYHVTYKRPAIEVARIKQKGIDEIDDFLNIVAMAKFRKLMAGNQVDVVIAANAGNGAGVADFTLRYCDKTVPQKLPPPDQASMAVGGLQPCNCPIMNANNPGALDFKYEYWDEAVFFFGAGELTNKTVRHNGWNEDQYFVSGVPAGNTGCVNLVVIMRGNKENIDDLVKMTNWKALAALAGK